MYKITKRINIIRWGVRTGFLLFIGEFAFYGIFRCPFAIPYVSCESCPVVQCPGRTIWLPVWIIIFGSALLFGRAFCGWACPVGTFSDLLGKPFSVRGKLNDKILKAASHLKYVVLILSLILLIVYNNPRWAVPIRTGDFFASIGLTFDHANLLWISRTVFVSAAIVLGVFFSNIWCRFLCPTGGILDIFNRFSIFKFRMTSDCNDCQVCKNKCSMNTRPAEINCNNCGECISLCPVDSIKYGRSNS